MNKETLISLLLLTRMRVKQERKELAAHRLPRWNRRDAFKRRSVGSRSHAIAKHVDDRGPSRSVSLVFVRAVNHQRVMKRRFSLFQFNRNRLEVGLLLFG